MKTFDIITIAVATPLAVILLAVAIATSNPMHYFFGCASAIAAIAATIELINLIKKEKNGNESV